MPLEVIGAGFGRTGTLSLKMALDELGLHCYHFAEIAAHPADINHWDAATTAVFENGGTFDFDCIFSPSEPGRQSYRAGVDCPVNVFYRALMQQYPNAKVILTVRDSPEAWHRSQLNTVHKWSTQNRSWWVEAVMQLRLTWRKKQAAADRKWWSPWLYDRRFPDPAFAKRLYEDHIAEVRAAVPAEKLLVFNVKEGWQPLCAFLGLPVPGDKPFPRTNTTEEMEQMMRLIHASLEATAAVAAAGLALLTAAAVAGAVVMIRRRRQS